MLPVLVKIAGGSDIPHEESAASLQRRCDLLQQNCGFGLVMHRVKRCHNIVISLTLEHRNVFHFELNIRQSPVPRLGVGHTDVFGNKVITNKSTVLKRSAHDVHRSSTTAAHIQHLDAVPKPFDQSWYERENLVHQKEIGRGSC